MKKQFAKFLSFRIILSLGLALNIIDHCAWSQELESKEQIKEIEVAEVTEVKDVEKIKEVKKDKPDHLTYEFIFPEDAPIVPVKYPRLKKFSDFLQNNKGYVYTMTVIYDSLTTISYVLWSNGDRTISLIGLGVSLVSSWIIIGTPNMMRFIDLKLNGEHVSAEAALALQNQLKAYLQKLTIVKKDDCP